MLPDSFGFARGHRPCSGSVRGFRTGDMVRAVVPAGKKAGTYLGRVAVRSSGSFNIRTGAGTIQGIGHGRCRIVQRADGYAYAVTPSTTEQGAAFLPAINGGVSARNV